MIKLIHWCAVRTSDLAVRLWETAGAVELWCDERAYRKRWVKWGKQNGVAMQGWVDVPLAQLRPEDFVLPSLDGYKPVTPRPMTLLDEEQD
jgi:hypothetical protein